MNHIASPDTSDAGLERAIQAKGLTAPRITPDNLEANIGSEHYYTGLSGVMHADTTSQYASDHEVPVSIEALGLLTHCTLVLRNGFTVTGESACASPMNFDAEIGRKAARANAVNKIWPLMGYALKQELHAQLAKVNQEIAAALLVNPEVA